MTPSWPSIYASLTSSRNPSGGKTMLSSGAPNGAHLKRPFFVPQGASVCDIWVLPPPRPGGPGGIRRRGQQVVGTTGPCTRTNPWRPCRKPPRTSGWTGGRPPVGSPLRYPGIGFRNPSLREMLSLLFVIKTFALPPPLTSRPPLIARSLRRGKQR